ncbi:unnamed protein product, partial [Allacma fusca]
DGNPDEFGRSLLSNGSLHITSLVQTRQAKPDEGLYQCVATVPGIGSVLSRSAKLQAAFLTRFDEEPEDISIGLGQTARFGCSAQGIPPPVISWYKDDRALVLDDSRMTVLPSGSLEISAIQTSDEGVYKCNISNVDRFSISRKGRLVLNRNPERDTPPVFTAVPRSQTVVAPNSVVLECSAVAYPQPRITWLKDGVTIDLENLDSRYSLVGEGNLMISTTEESDRGTYQCRAENREDSTDVSATLDIHVMPRVLSTPANFFAYEKEDVELPCKIYGKPAPAIEWYKNAEMIFEGDYFQIVNGNNLKILGLVASDAGMYQCVGTNPAGNVQASVHLQVLKPGEIKPISDVEAAVSVETLPLPLPVKPFLGQSLPIPRLGGNGNGVSENHTASPDGPSAPREVAAVLVSTRFVTLTWKAPLITNGRIVAYAIFYKELGSDRERVLNTTKSRLEEINVQGLQPNKRYTFRVVPYNDKGAGVSSREITVLTQPEVDVPGPPRFLKAWPSSPTKVHLQWAPPEQTHGNVMKYKVYYAEATNGNEGTSEEKPFPLDFDESTLIDESESDDDDEDDYLLPKQGGIQMMTVTSPEAVLDDLRIYTDYFVWVLAVNENGPGANSEQVKVRTLSAEPGDTPHNVTLESSSSTSIAIRWEPPPMEFRNGIITGYKIKYKPKGRKRAETVTSDGNSRFCPLTGLEKGAEYQVKIAALNINGTGPFTEWLNAMTYQRDLDETQVPDKPESLHAHAMTDSITISWSPPRNTNIMVRGYTIGWGKGIPDEYNKLVDGKRRFFTLDKLKPNSDYVISLRAYNNIGDGIPIYENVRTRETSDEEDEDHGLSMAQLPPPVGLRAMVLSPTSVVLYWTDSSLPKTQVVSDKRYYVVRYLPTEALALSQKRSSVKHVNTSELNTILDDLRPGTQYEFSVKVVKTRYSSEWSLVAYNTTFEATPHSPPQDLTLLAITGEDGKSSVVLNWQPPRMTKDDEMKGYMVFYTTNPSLKEWVEDPIPDDVLTHKVPGLTPDTVYYFRMAARHSKGLGPFTDIKSISTPVAKRAYGGHGSTGGDRNVLMHDSQGKPNQLILYILIGLSVIFALASVSLCIYYRKRGSELAESPKQSSLKKQRKPELKPPDLWIHHDQMELKNLEKTGGTQAETPISPSTRGSREIGDPEEKIPLQHTTNSLDKRNFMSSYLGDNSQIQSIQCHSLGRRKPKPIRIPVEPFCFKSDVGGGGAADLRNNPIFSRNSQSQYRSGQMLGDSSSGQNVEPHKTYDSVPSGSSTASSQHNLSSLAQYGPTSDYGTQSAGSSIGTLNRRTGGNLKSFAVPVPPMGTLPSHHPTTPQQTKASSRSGTGTVVGILPNSNQNSAIQSSPIKRISTSQFPPMNVGSFPQQSSMSPKSYGGADSPSMQKCYSTEELSQEISNLEGLMKDLNAITANGKQLVSFIPAMKQQRT